MADEQSTKNASSTGQQDRARLSIFVYRKQGLSLDEFQKYWREQHSGLFSSIAIVKENLLSYQQVRGTQADHPPIRGCTPANVFFIVSAGSS